MNVASAGNVATPGAALTPEPMEQHVVCTTLKVGQVVFKLLEHELQRELGLKIRHYSVVGTLSADGPMSQQAISTFLRVDSATMVAAIDELEQRGFVERERAPEDRRRYVVRLTEEGNGLLNRINGLIDDFESTILGSLTEDQRSVLKKTMITLSRSPEIVNAYDSMRRNGAGILA